MINKGRGCGRKRKGKQKGKKSDSQKEMKFPGKESGRHGRELESERGNGKRQAQRWT